MAEIQFVYGCVDKRKYLSITIKNLYHERVEKNYPFVVRLL